jgi:hypothetical protein
MEVKASSRPPSLAVWNHSGNLGPLAVAKALRRQASVVTFNILIAFKATC